MCPDGGRGRLACPRAWTMLSTSGLSAATSHHLWLRSSPSHTANPSECRSTWSGGRKMDLRVPPVPDSIFNPREREKKQHQCQHAQPGDVATALSCLDLDLGPARAGGRITESDPPGSVAGGAWTDVYRRMGAGRTQGGTDGGQ